MFSQQKTSSPIQIGSSTNWSKVAVSYQSVAAINSEGSLFSWGNNSYGQLGSRDLNHRSKVDNVGQFKNWKYVFSSFYHFAAIKDDKSLWLWGSNDYGQIGNGSTTNQSSPVRIGGNGVRWLTASCGFSFSAAIHENGSLYTWGVNNYGQLGDGTKIAKSTPVKIGALTDWASISCGGTHALAIKNDGTLWSWGDNYAGQLGTSNVLSKSNPVKVGNLTDWASVSAGSSISMAIKSDGTLWGWGVNNPVGRFGSSVPYATSPVKIGMLTNWSSISCGGAFAYSVKTDGTLWSLNGISPVQIGSLTNWSSVSCGSSNSAAIKTDNTLWAWDWSSYPTPGNTFGCLDNSQSSYSFGLYNNFTISDVYDMIGGDRRVGFLKGDGTLWSLGFGGSSPTQLGSATDWSSVYSVYNNIVAINSSNRLYFDGSSEPYSLPWYYFDAGWNNTLIMASDNTLWSFQEYVSKPTQVGTLNTWNGLLGRGISAGGSFYAAIKTDGSLWTWGRNDASQCGLGSTVAYYSSPTQVYSAINWSSVSCGGLHAAGIKTDGTLWTWGYNSNGQLGLGDSTLRSSPIRVGALTDWSTVSCGLYHTLAIKTDGTLWAWGKNNLGQLGDGSTDMRVSPVKIGNFTNWTNISAGVEFSAGIRYYNEYGGELFTWGDNSSYQLGLGDNTSRNSPVKVGSSNTWFEIASGSSHMIGINHSTYFDLFTWGNNTYGQLGDGTKDTRSVPVKIGSSVNWGRVSAGYETSFAQYGFALFSFGRNNYGQLGLDDTVDRSSPSQIGSFENCWKMFDGVKGRSYHVIKTDGTLWSWGDNTSGQLGDGTSIGKSVPLQVGALTDWSSGSVGNGFFASIKTDGTLWTCGSNVYGQLGQSDYLNRSTPTKVGNLTDWSMVSCGDNHVLAVKTDGTLWSFGGNQYGQLGFVGAVNSPVKIGSSTNWTFVSAGEYHSVAVNASGEIYVFGSNLYGQCFGKSSAGYSSPVKVGTSESWSFALAGTTFTVLQK